MSKLAFGFLGAGKMATALATGLIRQGMAWPDRLLASDPVPAARTAFAKKCEGRTTTDNREVAAHADVLLIATKPGQVPEVCHEIKDVVSAKTLVISIAAGVTLKTLATELGDGPRLVRVMPNTPCLIAEGVSGYCLGPGTTSEDGPFVAQLLGCVGKVVSVSEAQLDAVTGLSGSGPAFVYLMVEALADGGVLAGLPRDVALQLAAQTVRGAASMVLETGEHPGALKDQVASPAGTTIAGLAVLEQAGLRGALIAAVDAASRRAKELGQPKPV
ncbi:MAG TPA: pyrroline-5-carboxylate reductase [Pirellulales bacterium]